ncbi:MAG: hypothetical protein ACR2LQ_04430 [Acidimicrobiales bacterium]
MSDLASLGLRVGARVRWRRGAGGRWNEGRVERVEADGSVGVRDGKGASRALVIERIEVASSGPRGGSMWESLAERAVRTEQMELF